MLSVIIIARNEEHNIRRCLESIQWANEIIVLDSGSTDRTVEIAQEYTPYVYKTDWQGYGVQKQRALTYASCDWVLNLDADESVDAILKQSLMVAMSKNQADAYRIPIRMWFYDKALCFSSSPSRHIRLFKRQGACYSNDIVHEKIVLPAGARVARIRSPIRHHSYQDVSHAISKMNRYSSYSAKIRLCEKRKPSLWRVLSGAWWMFIRCYFLQRGFMDGRAGFLMAVLNAQGSLYRGIKQIYPDHQLDEIPSVQK